MILKSTAIKNYSGNFFCLGLFGNGRANGSRSLALGSFNLQLAIMNCHQRFAGDIINNLSVNMG